MVFRKERRWKVRKGDITTEAKVRVRQDQEPKNVDSLQELENAKNGLSPKVSRRNTAL